MKKIENQTVTNVLIVPRFQRVRQGFISMRSFAGKIRITIKAGAEFLINSVWHSGNEVPKKHKDLLIELNEGFHICQFKDGYSFLGYYDNRGFIAFEVIRWAYIKDLIPNMED